MAEMIPDDDNIKSSLLSSGQRPHSLRDALTAVGRTETSSPADSASEEDYDDESRGKGVAVLVEAPVKPSSTGGTTFKAGHGVHTPSDTASETEVSGHRTTLNADDLKGAKIYTVASDDKALREILRRGLQRAKGTAAQPNQAKFRDYVFTTNFSTFDRQNAESANSIFHGFYTLLWIGVVFGMLKIGAENWKRTGSPLGTNEIMKYMFRRDVVVLLLSDGIMCALTGVSWLLQLAVFRGYLDWDRSGWIVQHLWQTSFIAGGIALTQLREWPWSHTVFFVMHILVMLMKQHSYAFYNGYLSSIYKKRAGLIAAVKYLDTIKQAKAPASTLPLTSAVTTSYLDAQSTTSELRDRRRSVQFSEDNAQDLETIAAAIDSGKPLDREQIHVFRKVIQSELDSLSEELQGKATQPERSYPHNLTFLNHYEYIPLPTVVYELEYPRSATINWYYVAEKVAATFGVIFVMMMISQAFIYPVVIHTQEMKASGMPLRERIKEFPWYFSDMLFPLMMEYLLSWYLIWEVILNLLAELTYFADRTFYKDWWNSVSWDQFARDWNRPVHNFLLRHVYHSSISTLKVNKYTATLITFFLSACVHELVMWCIFSKLRGYLLLCQMSQLPLVALSRTRFLKGRKTLGNAIFWVGIFLGPSMLCSLYLVL